MRADLQVTGQANTAIREGQAGGKRVTQGMIRSDILAGQAGRGGFRLVRQRSKRRLGDVGVGLVSTLLAANPLGGAMFIIVTVAEQPVAERTEGIALFVVTAFQAGEGLVIAVHGQQADGAQGLQIVVDVAQDLFIAFTSISQQFPNLQQGKAAAQHIETRDGEQVIVEVSRGARAGEGPE